MLTRFFRYLFIALSLTTLAQANAGQNLFKGGHAKYFFQLADFPDDSLYLDYIDSPAIDHNGDLRLKFGWRQNKLSIVTDYQLIGRHGDSITLSNSLPGQVLSTRRIPTDK